MSDPNFSKDLTLCPGNMPTSDEMIEWVLTVLSSTHLTEEDILNWWGKEIQFDIPSY